MVDTEEPAVEERGVDSEEDPGWLEGGGEAFQDEASDSESVDEEVQLIPHAGEVVPHLRAQQINHIGKCD